MAQPTANFAQKMIDHFGRRYPDIWTVVDEKRSHRFTGIEKLPPYCVVPNEVSMAVIKKNFPDQAVTS